jgi:hypothetical protein
VVKRASGIRPIPCGADPGNRSTLWIAVAGAVAYSSWPLVFLVNPSLAGTALASSFEGRSQPFSWLFILLDCFAGLCTVIVCARFLHPRRGRRPPGRALVLALLGYAVFGVTTAVDAVVPLNCGGSSAQECAAQLWPITPDDLLTGVAVLGLFVAVAILIVRMVRTPFPLVVPATTALAATGWCALGLIVLLGSTSSASAATAQYVFLTLTSLLTLVVPVEAATLLGSRPAGSPREVSPLALGSLANQGTLDRWGTAAIFSSGALRSAEPSRTPPSSRPDGWPDRRTARR